MKNSYSWDEICKALDYLDEYDKSSEDISSCPPLNWQSDCNDVKNCKQCRLEFALCVTE